MLQILEMENTSKTTEQDGVALLKQNPKFRFTIRAPMYWWIDLDVPKYLFDMPLEDWDFCFDAFTDEEISHLQGQYEDLRGVSIREKMQILPLGTIVTAIIELTYLEIVEYCEQYTFGNFDYFIGYGFPNEREWKDFCETLLDITGVRDVVKEEK